MADDQQEQSLRDRLLPIMTDTDLDEAINRQKRNVEIIGPLLRDRGEKLRVNLKRLEDELERRKSCLVEKDDDGCKHLTQSNGPHFTSTLDGLRQDAPSSLPASHSVSAARFCEKFEDAEEKLSDSLSKKKNASQAMSSDYVRPRNA